MQTWVVPAGVTEIGLELAGAQGGHAYGGGGVGARLAGTVTVTPGATLNIVVGGAGANGVQYQAGSGGGGGSFVYTTATQAGLLAAAGGGGGAGSNSFPTSASLGSVGENGTNGGGAGGSAGAGGQGSPFGSRSLTGGGGGLLTSGGNAVGGQGLAGGAAGGSGARAGGFGGGGGADGSAGGGGGGYSGGGGGNFGQNGEAGGGGGGGSYFSGTLANSAVDQGGNGIVKITYPSVVGSVSATIGKAGDALTLSGAGLAGATATIGGVAATVMSSSDRQLVLTIPARSPLPLAAQPIVVTIAGGSALTAPSEFTYAPIPTVTAMSPSTGLVYGGKTIEITGTGLENTQGVFFGDEFASFIESSGTTISVTVPSSVVGTVDVTVITLGGVSATSAATRYTYFAPTIGVAPSLLGAIKQGVAFSLTLSASGAQSSSYNFAVTDGELPTGLSLSNGVIHGIPSEPGLGAFVITATSVDSFMGSRLYTFVVASSVPVITSVAPATGIAGGAVTITGTDLDGASVTIGGEAAQADSSASNTDTSLTVLAPAVAPGATGGAVDVTVTNDWGSDTESDAFAYIPPTVSGATPSTGSVYGGTIVTLAGTGFVGATAVKFGSENAASFTVNSDTSITAASPAGSAGNVDITVTTANGVTSTSAASEFSFAAPTISVSPQTLAEGKQGVAYAQALTAAGAASGPYEFEVTDGALPDGLALAADGTLTGTPTEHGSFDVTVTGTSPDDYTGSADYTIEIASSVPTIAGISPDKGNAGGAVTITGTDLDGASVTFGGEAAPIDASATNTATSLTVLVPTVLAGSEGKSVDVQVTNPWGEATAASAFTYNAPSVELSVQFKVGDTAKGAKVAFVASGFAAAQSVTAVVHSTPTTIYSAFTGAGGTLDATVTLPAVEKGSHKLVITAGAESQTVWFAVDAAGKITAVSTTGPVGNPADIIALTGAEMGPALFGAMGLLVAGLLAGALALGGRRRREV